MRLAPCFPRACLLLLPAAAVAAAAPGAYDPLALPVGARPPALELVAHDAKRDRDVPLRVYLPAVTKPAPVVLFSHGLGGSRNGCRYLGEHWSARGYVAVFLQHPGSDDSVWRGAARGQRLAAMREAASPRNFLDRVQDVHLVLDQLESWNAAGPLAGRLDLKHVGMSGHSFGALTTQAIGGETMGARGTDFADPRVRAAIALSPSAPRGGDPARAFASVRIPWLLMTGTEDVAPIGDTDVASRLAVFPALPAGSKYELVLDGARHAAFTDRAAGDEAGGNPNHHRAVLAVSTAFWDACLRVDAAARAWLDGSGPAGVLEPKDRWQRK